MNVKTVSEYLDDNVKVSLENRTVDNTIDNKCSCCGECCSNCLPVSDKEIIRIKKYIKENNIKAQIHINPLLKNRTTYDMVCPFRDNANKKCLIYEVRPKVCKIFLCNKNVFKMAEKMGIKEKYCNIDMRNTFYKK